MKPQKDDTFYNEGVLYDGELKEDLPEEKQKRKAKRGERKLTPFGNAIIGSIVTMIFSISLSLAADTVPGNIGTILTIYHIIQFVFAVLGSIVFIFDSVEPEYPTFVDPTMSWQTFNMVILLWPVGISVYLYKKLSPLMFEKVD